MGRKPARKRKYLYFCLAGLIFSACTVTQEAQKPAPQPGELLVAEEFLKRDDFDKVIDESQRILSAEESPVLKDGALFTLGLVYAHPGNPGKDYTTAMGFFTQLINEYPQSPWATQAGIWMTLLQDNRTLHQSNRKFQEAIATLDLSFKNLSDERESLAQALKKMRDENDNLQQVIKKMKQVDIEIEERKRDNVR